LAADRDHWRADVDDQIIKASQGVQQERNRLAALVSDLSQSVVVCNLDGRILLFNNRARLQFRALATVSAVAGGAEWMGIGRSIYAVLDRSMLAHAIENIQQRLARGAMQPSTQFLTSTASGQLLRIHMAPVLQAQTEAGLTGFVLMLDNVTQVVEQDNQRTDALLALAEDTQTALVRVQAGLAQLPASDTLTQVGAQVQAMRTHLERIVTHAADDLKTRWPLEDMPANDLLQAAQRRIRQHSVCDVALLASDAAAWVKVDSFSVVQALTYLASRLVDEFDIKVLQLRSTQVQDKVHVDLIWSGQAMSTETVMGWELDPMRVGKDHNPLSVRDVMLRHSGALAFERERTKHQAYFRLVLPAAQAQESEATHALLQDSRPEFYDFDLFQHNEQNHALDDRLLTSLTYTVFDTETTGLHPTQGDEIIQIGATRIVNGKLLRSDAFEQLIDPGRHIPESTIPIHGITPDMVRGKPRIAQVLPAFHAYAADTVLVAHNAAFDMKFLQLQEGPTGLRFDHPVLDTLMLSAVIHPNQESHRLEAIAERMNITILGRHTALGDALVTAEAFLRMIPLLAEMGIHTYGQAREAAQKTYYARLKY
jgi:DNA polymerase III subunit epsilon